MKITTVGLDIAKSVFHFVGVNKAGKLVRKKMLKRCELLSAIARLEPCLIVMEACGGANYWARGEMRGQPYLFVFFSTFN